MKFLGLPTLLLVALVAAQNDEVTSSDNIDAPSFTDVAPATAEVSTASVPVESSEVVPPTGTLAVSVESSQVTADTMLSSSTVDINATLVVPTVTTAPKDPESLPPSPTPPSYITSRYWTYPQPPLPARTASAEPAAFTVAQHQPPRRPQTRNYEFNIGYSAGNPSGFWRRMTVINNQFPAPLIEGWQGDTIRVRVTNSLDIPQTIHWHGIVQNHTNFMDGVPGISQCPIKPGSSFTYEFKLVGEVGTYWYHSHFGNTLADGVLGAFIVHSRDDPLKKTRPGVKGSYDEDKILFLGDYYHDQSRLIAHGLHTWGVGYRGSNIAKMPDAVLFNGAGQEDCNMAQSDVRCGLKRPAEITGRRGQRIRLRLINHGSRAQLRFSIDQHVLQVIEIDDTPIKPLFLHELDIDPGQRYSVIVTLNQRTFDEYWMRAAVAAACVFEGYKMEGVGILRYTDARGRPLSGDIYPESVRWPVGLKDPLNSPCVDIDEAGSNPLGGFNVLEPLRPSPPPANTYGTFRFDSAFGAFVDHKGGEFSGFGFNPYSINQTAKGFTTFTNYINNPLLRQIEDGLTLNSTNQASLTFDRVGAVDLIINNRDGGLSHPYHIHGRAGYIMYRRENGQISQEEVPNLVLNDNPVKRDTYTIGGNSSLIIRLITDTPGVWPLHCHIGWHLAVGKMAVVVVQPDAIKQTMQRPRAWENLCAGTDKNVVEGDEYVPPKRRASTDLEERGNSYDIHPDRLPRDPNFKAPKNKRWSSPNGENVPYFSMNRLSYTLIDKGFTYTETVAPQSSSLVVQTTADPIGFQKFQPLAIVAPNGGPDVPLATISSTDNPQATDAYSTLTGRPASELWSEVVAPATGSAPAGSNTPVATGTIFASSPTAQPATVASGSSQATAAPSVADASELSQVTAAPSAADTLV